MDMAVTTSRKSSTELLHTHEVNVTANAVII